MPAQTPFAPGAMLQSVPRFNRTMRRPQHPFHLRTRPFVIQPFCIAPVLAGETLRNLMFQSRCVTDPIRNAFTGWWKEYYFFYVKLSQVLTETELTTLLLGSEVTSPSATITALYNDGGDANNFTADDTIKWVELCRDKVVSKWFRDEGRGETAATAAGLIANGTPAGNLPVAWIGRNDWTQSFVQTDHFEAGGMDRSLDVGFTATVDTSDAGQSDDPVTFTDENIWASEIEDLMTRYQLAKEQGLVQMSFDDYLAAQGVNVPSAIDFDRPELIRYVRSWQYPSNTIDPSDGSPVSAVSWVFQERADKDRFFAEPGFIFGMTIARPKVYKSQITGTAAGMLDRPGAWLPASLRDRPETSFLNRANGDAAFNPGESLTWDTRDLFLYGEHFINFSGSSDTAWNRVDLPSTTEDDTNHDWPNRYPDLDDLKQFFNDSSNDVLTRVREDGIVALNIAGRVEETSP